MGAFSIIKNEIARRVIVVAGLIAFVCATVYMFCLPLPTGFNFEDYFGIMRG